MAYVVFGREILEQPAEVRNSINGWFHQHPITGLSGLDVSTTNQLTRLWDSCHTLVLQQPTNKLLYIKTEKMEDLHGEQHIIKVLEREIPLSCHNSETKST